MRELRSLDLDKEALFRLRVMDGYERVKREGKVNIRYFCRVFGIGKSTFYKWRKRYNPYNLSTLKSRSRKPKMIRSTPWKTVVEICNWKRVNPAKSHYYLYQSWLKEGRIPPCSPKTIYNWWKRRNLILLKHKRKRRQTKLFNHAQLPGELIQIDTKFLPYKRYQYSAIDVVSKWKYARVYTNLTQENTIDFLARLKTLARIKNIKIERIQTDNGPEFQKEVIKYLADSGIIHQYIWIHTPDQNGIVERSHRTDEEEFYQLTDTNSLSLEELNQALEEWIEYYNTKRLHFSLNFDTPEEYLEKVSTI